MLLGFTSVIIGYSYVLLTICLCALGVIRNSINFIAFSYFSSDLTGQIFTLFILTVAAAEAAIGLAIIVIYYRNSGTIRVQEIDKLKG